MTEITSTETIMRNRTETYDGWTKGNGKRIIRLGNAINCNGDGIFKNYKIKEDMTGVLKKYEIDDFELREISNENEHSYELKLPEDIYEHFKNKMYHTK
jgi:hypothetical protein